MTPYLGQLILASWSYANKGFAMCNGQTMAISGNQGLFALLGTTYGGNGVTTFLLPNLQGRTPLSMGNGIQIGQLGGEDAHTLISAEVPGHTHVLNATTTAASLANPPTGNLLGATSGAATLYTGASNLAAMNSGTISPIGGQPHENRQPFLVMNWLIALTGIFPSRN